KEECNGSMRSDEEGRTKESQKKDQEGCIGENEELHREEVKSIVEDEVMSEIEDDASLKNVTNSGNGTNSCISANTSTNSDINDHSEEIVKDSDEIITSGNNKLKSYANTLIKSLNNDGNKLFTVPTSINSKSEEVVLFDKELVIEGYEKWKLTVCGYFVGCKMHVNVLKCNIRIMWTRYGLKDIVVDVDEMCFFKFKDEEGMKFIIDQIPWIVNGKPLIVQK
ncbi:RNA-directed DNA polymerase, eukaryota, reverse transcriptase zinc-binding domain protein, partial [Tanacetum coccineum]